METLQYSIDITKLTNIQNKQTIENNIKEEEFKREGIKNKKALLKYVLPFVHSVYELHNHKCYKHSEYFNRQKGLLGYGKIDIEKELDYIINTDFHMYWHHNFQSFTFCNRTINQKGKLSIWLNKREGCHKSTPNLEYSMTSFFGTYSESIEEELERIAKYCSQYTAEWK